MVRCVVEVIRMLGKLLHVFKTCLLCLTYLTACCDRESSLIRHGQSDGGLYRQTDRQTGKQLNLCDVNVIVNYTV